MRNIPSAFPSTVWENDRMTNTCDTQTCCQRGDWDSADHQPNGAILFVPVTVKAWPKSAGSQTYFDQTPTVDYRWECIYCGKVGTAAELKATV